MKKSTLFYRKIEVKLLKRHLLQFLFGALRVYCCSTDSVSDNGFMKRRGYIINNQGISWKLLPNFQ